MTKDYSTNPTKLSTEELVKLKESMEIDPERFQEHLKEIREELSRRPNYSNLEISMNIQ